MKTIKRTFRYLIRESDCGFYSIVVVYVVANIIVWWF